MGEERPPETVPSSVGIVGIAEAASLMVDIEFALRKIGIDSWSGSDLNHHEWARTEVLVSIGIECGDAEMEIAPHLRGLVSPLLGYEWFDLDAATRRGVAVVNSEVPENRDGMAEATIMLILALLYRLRKAEKALRTWDVARLADGRLLRDKTVGVIGLGGIARGIIARLKPFGCTFLAHSKVSKVPADVTIVALEELMRKSDVVVVATSLRPDTYHMLGEDMIGRMKTQALLVNTTRGAIVDESALVRALQEGRIAGAALDVFEEEPLPLDHPLRELDSVILTPHAIGHTVELAATLPRHAANSVNELLAGTLPTGCKNPTIAPRWLAAPSAAPA